MKFSISVCLSLVTIILLNMYNSSMGQAQQIKREYEKSIKKEQIPERILELITPLLQESRRLRYYEEYDGEKTGYEIEMQWQGRRLSVEFYEDGRLMDIEELIAFEEIEKNTREALSSYLKSTFDKYKINRLQRQYTAEEEDEEDHESTELIEDFIEGDTEDLIVRFEMVAQVKGNDMYGSYEFLFDHEGELLNVLKIERRSSDNVLY